MEFIYYFQSKHGFNNNNNKTHIYLYIYILNQMEFTHKNRIKPIDIDKKLM